MIPLTNFLNAMDFSTTSMSWKNNLRSISLLYKVVAISNLLSTFAAGTDSGAATASAAGTGAAWIATAPNEKSMRIADLKFILTKVEEVMMLQRSYR